MNLSKDFLEWWESFLKKCNYTREQVFDDIEHNRFEQAEKDLQLTDHYIEFWK